jgi:hypothetical protein
MHRIRVSAIQQAYQQCLEFHGRGEKPPAKYQNIIRYMDRVDPEAITLASVLCVSGR